MLNICRCMRKVLWDSRRFGSYAVPCIENISVFFLLSRTKKVARESTGMEAIEYGIWISGLSICVYVCVFVCASF
jgi:hypothetical protein